MKCPFCQSPHLKVIDSRDALDVNAIRRRRECLECQRRFTTFETIELTIQVLKRDGRYEEFSREKLIRGLESACHHTRVSRDRLLALANEITREMLGRQEKVISTNELGEIVMEHLKILDPVAYIRFACVYRRFTDIGEVMREITLNTAGKER